MSNNRYMKRRRLLSVISAVLLAVLILCLGTGCTGADGKNSGKKDTRPAAVQQRGQPVSEDGEYSSKDEVALYLHLYEHLPDNYITKSEAKALGWNSHKGNLWDVAPGKSIGGDCFGNLEDLLPKKKSRKYYECDVDYYGGFRNEKRIVYSNDGMIYYSDDHYNSFEQLYGEND